MRMLTKKTMATLLALVMVLLSWSIIPVGAADVALNPGDGLTNAIKNASGGDTITLTDGVYYVPSSVTIGKQLTIKAEPWSHPIIFGGKKLTGWESYNGNIYRAPYTSQVMALVENGKAGKIATTPTYKATGVSGNNTIRGTVPSGLTNNYAKVMTYGATSSNWQSSVNVITSTSGNSLTFTGNTVRGISSGCIYEILNDKVVIDEPGEFAYDGQYVYYYPYNTSNLDSQVSVATTQTIFSVSKAGDLTLDGVDIAGTNSQHSGGAFVEAAAVSVNGTLTATRCNFYAIDSSAIRYAGTAGMTVDHCTFDHIGGCALNLPGSNAVVSNCEIYNSAAYSYGNISIEYGNNNLISHNRIAHSAVRGINLNGANSSNGWGNVIEYNDIFDCNTKVSDTGLIYLYRMDGATADKRNVIRYNAFHDSKTQNHMGFGIYLDDDADYTDVYGNWVYNLTGDPPSGGFLMGPIMIKGIGSNVYDNVIAYNYIAKDKEYGENGTVGNNNAVFVVQELGGYTTRDNNVKNNIIYKNSGNNCLYRIMDDTNPFRLTSDYNVFGESLSNYRVSAAGVWDINGWLNKGYEAHSLQNVDPQFTDPENGDFTVNNKSITSAYYNNTLTVDQLGPQAQESTEPTAEPTAQPDDAVLSIADKFVSAGTGTVEVKVPVTLSKVTREVTGMELKVNYTKGITLKDVERGPILESLTYTKGEDLTKKPYKMLWDGLYGDTDANGVAFTMTFEVPVEKVATYEVVIGVETIYDDNYDDIPIFVKSGKIQVNDFLLGDVNSDGVVSTKDVTALRRALANGTAEGIAAADFNGDGSVTSKDITALRRALANGAIG